MNARIEDMTNRIIEMSLFGFLLGVFLALFMGTAVSKPVNKLVEGADRIAKGDFDTKVDIQSRDELGFLGESFNQMAKDLGASLAARVYKERVGHELELARDIQDKIIPKNVPVIAGLDVSASINPATEVGGDLYDFIPVDSENTLMYLGDVTGHGVPSAMIGAIANSLFYSYANLKEPELIVANVNSILKKKMMSTMFMTLCMVKWNSVSGILNYVNAGHDPILLYRNGEITEGESGGLAMGMVPDISCKLKKGAFEMKTGEVAVIYSDGIPEAWKNEKESYGMERFKDSIKKTCAANPSATAGEIKDEILKDVREFMGEYEQKDDITIIVFKRK